VVGHRRPTRLQHHVLVWRREQLCRRVVAAGGGLQRL